MEPPRTVAAHPETAPDWNGTRPHNMGPPQTVAVHITPNLHLTRLHHYLNLTLSFPPHPISRLKRSAHSPSTVPVSAEYVAPRAPVASNVSLRLPLVSPRLA